MVFNDRTSSKRIGPAIVGSIRKTPRNYIGLFENNNKTVSRKTDSWDYQDIGKIMKIARTQRDCDSATKPAAKGDGRKRKQVGLPSVVSGINYND